MRLLAWLLVAALCLSACGGGDDEPPSAASPTSSPSPSNLPPLTTSPSPTAAPPSGPPPASAYYVLPGNGGLDALHYGLQLSWAPTRQVLSGVETLAFRSVGAPARLDLSRHLRVSSAQVDGRPTTYAQKGDLLTFDAPAHGRHTLVLEYAGVPRGEGLKVQKDGGLWTVHEPTGAFWSYAVDDQPSDKARYDFSLSVPAPFVGIANGRLVSLASEDGTTRTRFHLDEPASSYLTTLAFGDYTMSSGGTVDGTPLRYWTPTGDQVAATKIRAAAAGLRWLEQRLGPYPFDTLSFIVVKDVRTAVETQTTITQGDTDYTLQPDSILHEIAHQWYGDEVTPSDWRDLWMSEGMAMYLQATWLGTHSAAQGGQGGGVEKVLEGWVQDEQDALDRAGPPAAYDPKDFADLNTYYGPAMMWDQVRRQVGDHVFWAMVRDWPSVHRYGNADRATYEAWVSQHVGQDVSPIMDAWLDSATSPPFPG